MIIHRGKDPRVGYDAIGAGALCWFFSVLINEKISV
jgi:hypothetical protein